MQRFLRWRSCVDYCSSQDEALVIKDVISRVIAGHRFTLKNCRESCDLLEEHIQSLLWNVISKVLRDMDLIA